MISEERMKEASSATRRDYWAFGLYDFSNSGYVLIFQSFLFPLLVASMLAGSDYQPEVVWGGVVAASTVIAILLAPRLGAVGDRCGRPRLFAWHVGAVVLLATATLLLSSVSVFIVVAGFLIFNALFELSQSLYDSFLKDLAKSEAQTIKLSAFGWGLGYLGGAIFALLYLLLETRLEQSWLLILFVVLYGVLSVPAIRHYRRVGAKASGVMPAFRDVIRGIWILKTRSPIAWHRLAVYWLIVDVVTGVMYFSPMYMGETLGIEQRTIGIVLLTTQAIAFPATVAVASLAHRLGVVVTIRLCLVGWVVALGLMFAARDLTGVLVAMVPIVFVIGSTQALLRAHFAQRVAQADAGVGFGYYAVAQKGATVFTPLLVAAIAYQTGSARLVFPVLGGMVLLAFYLASRLALLCQVDGPNFGG